MKNRIIFTWLVLMLTWSFSACAPQAQAAEIPAIPDAIVQGDPTEGQADLMDVLQKAGVTVELGDPIDQPFFSVPGRVLKVNGADVQVFEYPSTEAMESDASQVSADGSSVGTSMMMWMGTPHFFKSGHMLVLYVGEDAAVLMALQSALGEQFAGG